MAVHIGGSRYPDCFGNFQGTSRTPAGISVGGDPSNTCRNCQPFRKCREETLKQYREDHGIRESEPICMNNYNPATIACTNCKVMLRCRDRTEIQRQVVEVKSQQNEEDALLTRLKKKVQDQWGGPDAEFD